MTDLFLIGALDACGGLLPIVKVIVSIMKVVTIIIPIALIVYGTIDLVGRNQVLHDIPPDTIFEYCSLG